jgi:hypothetical protein
LLNIPVVDIAAQGPPTAARPRNDYSLADAWLCRPGRTDACSADLTTTVVTTDGTLSHESWTTDAGAPIDCFYVYPTVSQDTGVRSDMTAGDEERNVVLQQFARFASKCRPYAPLYRQVTLAGLRLAMTGRAPPGDPEYSITEGAGYDDVRDAWMHYLAHDNNGRGVVLIGHSQGSFTLAELIGKEIDGKPIQSRIVSAILTGMSLAVPRGKDVGGAFKSMPLCRRAEQTGCVISYASFRSTIPPPQNAVFGRVQGTGMESACTNPAALEPGASGSLHAYLTGAGSLVASRTIQTHQWVAGGPRIETPFVSVPGLLSARCVSNDTAAWLEVTVHADPADRRADDIPGDVGAGANVVASWGLHLIDMNVAMGNLVDLVGRQGKAFLARNGGS